MKELRKLFGVLGEYRQWYYVAGVLLVSTSFIRMLEPKILQIAVDGVVVFFQENGKSTADEAGPVARFFYGLLPEISLDNLGQILIYLGLIYLVIASLRAISAFGASSLVASSTEKSAKRLRDRLFEQIQRLPLSFHGDVPTGEMVQRCTGDIDTVRRFMMNDVAEAIRLSAIFVGSVIMMASVHVPYTLIAIAIVPFIFLNSWYFFSKESKVWQEHEDEADKLTAIIQENLSGIRVVKAFAREPEEIEKFSRQNKAKLKVGLKHVRLHQRFWALSDFMVNLQVSVSLFAGGYFVLMQAISIGEFASFVTYSIMVTWPMRSVGQMVSRMGMAAVAMDRMSAILEAEPEDYHAEIMEVDNLRGDIVFEDVEFAYPDKPDEKILKGLSLHIKPGEQIAIAGPTGAGKSTMIALLLRFYEPDAGRILLDGKALHLYDKHLLRSRLGVVLQQPFLFSSSIKANIAYERPNASPAEIDAAAMDASIYELFERFPEGVDTVVGEKGVTLSGGQKQRVALARTLLAEPDVLILDDTTSAVDTETEWKIRSALEEKHSNRTTISISHRLTSMQQADRILVIEDGRLTAEGSPFELADKSAYFRKVSQVQLALEEDMEGDLHD